MALSQKLEAFTAAFKSKEAFISALETKRNATGREEERNRWKNEDLDLSPPADRTWGWYDFAAFWCTYGINPGTWKAGSALVSVGMSPWQASICIFVGYLFGAIGMVLHSRSASVYHFGFPVEARIAFGLRGSYIPILFRVMTALIWNGISVMQGGFYTAVLLRCIFGDAFWKMHNPIPASSGITLPNFIGLLIYWVLTFPILNVPRPKFRRWVEVQAVVMPFAMFGLFAYCMVTGRGAEKRPLSTSGGPVSGSLGWAMVSGINYMMGQTSTLQLNQPDIARYARSKRSTLWSQLLALPVANTVGAVLGIFGTAAIYNKWGSLDWNPWILEHDILDHTWGPGSRAGIFFLSAFFIFSNAVKDMIANIIPFGADFMTLFPRWLNIQRGMWLAYILSLPVCPWFILSSAKGFLTFLNGYSIFLGPFLGVLITDYFVIRKGNVYIKDLYEQTGRYWYRFGWHWRPFVAWVIPVAFVLPGFAQTFGNKLAGGGAGWSELYKFSWFFVCTLSSVIHFGLSFVGDHAKEERSMEFEALAAEQHEIIDAVAPPGNVSVTELSFKDKV